MVEAAPNIWCHKEFGVQLAGDEADFALAQQRDDRVLHRAQPGQRGHHHQGFQGGGQLPGHHGPRADTPFGEGGGSGARGVVELACGQAATVLVGEKRPVRSTLRRIGNQRPERAGASQRQRTVGSVEGGRNPECATATDTPVPIGPFSSTSTAEPLATRRGCDA